MSDKRTTIDDIVGELRSGMTIGIGGWGSRRKPMAVVRAICRSDLTDLTIVAYGGPDVGLLCATGKVRKVVCGFVTLDSIALDPHWRAARQHGRVEVMEVDEGMFFLGLQAASWRVPFLPTRAGLGSDVLTINPDLKLVRSPYGADHPYLADPADADVELVAMPALHLHAAIVHTNRADAAGNGQILSPDPFFDPLFLGAAERRFMTTEALVDNGALADGTHPLSSVPIHRMLVDGVAVAPGGAHFTANPPDYGRDEKFQREYAAAATDPVEWEAFARRYVLVDDDEYGANVAARRAVSDPGVTRAESCVIACADTWREAGEVMVSPFGTIPALGARLAKLTFSPDIVLTDGEAALMVGAPPIAAKPGELVREAAMPYRSVFDVVWSGRRNMMMMASQIDRSGNQNISAIGPHDKPKVQLVGVRGAPGNSVNHPTSYWVPDHTVRTFVEQVDVVSGVGYARAAAAGAGATRFHDIPRVVSNLGVFDFETPDRTMRLRSYHPGVSVDEVVAATGFPLTVPGDVAETRLPTPEELDLIRTVLDPGALRDREVRS